MCLGQPKQPELPKQAPLPPPPAPPPPPALAPQAPQALQTKKTAPGIKLKRSRSDASGAVSRGTNQLRIPVNTGSGKAGGLNL